MTSAAVRSNRFFVCNVVGARATELESNAEPLVEPLPCECALDLAFREFTLGLLNARFNLLAEDERRSLNARCGASPLADSVSAPPEIHILDTRTLEAPAESPALVDISDRRS